jgi:hypothetical protein
MPAGAGGRQHDGQSSLASATECRGRATARRVPAPAGSWQQQAHGWPAGGRLVAGWWPASGSLLPTCLRARHPPGELHHGAPLLGRAGPGSALLVLLEALQGCTAGAARLRALCCAVRSLRRGALVAAPAAAPAPAAAGAARRRGAPPSQGLRSGCTRPGPWAWWWWWWGRRRARPGRRPQQAQAGAAAWPPWELRGARGGARRAAGERLRALRPLWASATWGGRVHQRGGRGARGRKAAGDLDHSKSSFRLCAAPSPRGTRAGGRERHLAGHPLRGRQGPHGGGGQRLLLARVASSRARRSERAMARGCAAMRTCGGARCCERNVERAGGGVCRGAFVTCVPEARRAVRCETCARACTIGYRVAR